MISSYWRTEPSPLSLVNESGREAGAGVRAGQEHEISAINCGGRIPFALSAVDKNLLCLVMCRLASQSWSNNMDKMRFGHSPTDGKQKVIWFIFKSSDEG